MSYTGVIFNVVASHTVIQSRTFFFAATSVIQVGRMGMIENGDTEMTGTLADCAAAAGAEGAVGPGGGAVKYASVCRLLIRTVITSVLVICPLRL